MAQDSSSGSERGQVVLEYILLLIVALALSAGLLRALIGTSAEPAGVRAVWTKLVQAIGADTPD